METQPSHPFFVYGKGWASFSVEEALNEHGLQCQRLEVGDVCISLTPRADQTKSSPPPPLPPSSEATASPQNLSRKQMPQTISTTATGTAVTSRQTTSSHYEPSPLLYSQHHHQHQQQQQQLQQQQMQRHLSDPIYGMLGRPPVPDSLRKFNGHGTTTAMPPPPAPSSTTSLSSSSADNTVAMASYDAGEAIDATMHSRKRRTWSICENICDDPKKSKPN